MKRDIILIEWVDSKGVTNWEDAEDMEAMLPCICYSVGFLLDDNEQYKTIALTLSETQVLGRLTIPICSIRNVRYLSRIENKREK